MSFLTEIHAFISSTVTRSGFSEQLLAHNFRSPLAWLELACLAALFAFCWWLALRLVARWIVKIRWRSVRHLVRRVTFPVLLLIGSMLSLTLWETGVAHAVWLRLAVLAANWMIALRLVLAVIHLALPNGRFSEWLEKTSSGVLWLWFVLWVSGIDDMIIGWLQSFQFSIGSSKLNLYMLLTGLLWVGVVMVLMMWLAKWIDGKIMAQKRLDINLRIVMTKLIKTLMMVLSVLIALPLVGIDLTVLSVFGGALGVGLGFGLQKIASNYVSGFIILADRSISPGDRLNVGGFTGYVTKITSRYVVLRGGNGQEALIPNETLVTSTVINESYSASALLQSLNLQVAYKTDLDEAVRILIEVAEQQERVSQENKPSAHIVGFAADGIDLRLNFWVNDPENGFAGLNSAILLEIWRRFQAAGIEFPYPQREVRILNADNASAESKPHAE